MIATYAPQNKWRRMDTVVRRCCHSVVLYIVHSAYVWTKYRGSAPENEMIRPLNDFAPLLLL